MITPADVVREALSFFGSEARALLALNLAKARLSGVPLSVSRLAFLSRLGRGNVYRVLRQFVSSGLALRVEGGYAGSGRLVGIVSPLLEDVDPVYAPFKYLPDTAYYWARVPFRAWLGPEVYLYVLDYRARGLEELRVELEEGRRRLEEQSLDASILSWVFIEGVSRRDVYGYGREGLPEASVEQAFADAFSFSPDPASFAIDLLWNIGVVDVDRVYDMCSNDRCRGIVAGLAAAYTVVAGKTYFKRDYFTLASRGPRDCYAGLKVKAEVRDNRVEDPIEMLLTTAIMWLIPDPIRTKLNW